MIEMSFVLLLLITCLCFLEIISQGWTHRMQARLCSRYVSTFYLRHQRLPSVHRLKENFDLNKLRYSKIIINTDADVDGSHIRTLLLTFFYRYVPELIENGNIYVALSPLYRIRKGGKDEYVYSDEELEKAIKKVGGNADIQRFKGLGEMNPDQLWNTTMDPKKRILKKIAIEDAIRADEIFSMLMGDVVGPRRKFIELNANIAEIDT